MRLNGWQRLWVFLCLVWVVSTLSITFYSYTTYNVNPSYFSIAFRLPQNYRNLFPDGVTRVNATHSERVDYVDGTSVRINFDDVLAISADDIRPRLINLAEINNNTISDQEIDSFRTKIIERQDFLRGAQNRFDEIVTTIEMERLEVKDQILYQGALIILIPPIALLLSGYGLAWVRRGFIQKL